MTRRDSWMKNYEDVEFDLPGVGGDDRLGSRSPTERHPMLPPKSHLKDGSSPTTGNGWTVGEFGSLPRDGQPHVSGAKPSASLPVSQHPTLAPPGTTNPIARIPRSHSAPKALPNSPLNPQHTASTTTTSSSMPFSSPFSHTRPGSRGSAYFSKIVSEEARAFGASPSSANHGLTSRGSMILYSVADPFSPLLSQPMRNGGADTPTSHYSLKGLVAADDGTLPLPDPLSRNRGSMYSTSGDSIVSLSSDSKYPNLEGQRSNLIAYVYDPDADESLEDDEEVDWLHDPETIIAEKLAKLRSHPAPQRPAYVKPPAESSLSWRGFLNITMLILLIVTILALFIAYPTVATINDGSRNKLIAFNTRINSTGQAVDTDVAPAQAGATTPTDTSTPTSTDSTTSTSTSTTPTPTDSTTTTSTSADDPTQTDNQRRRRAYIWDADRRLWVTDVDDKQAEDNGWWAVEKESRARRSNQNFMAR